MTGEPAPEQVVRVALNVIEDDLLHWGEPGATFDAEAVGDARCALDALVAQRDEARVWAHPERTSLIAQLQESEARVAELERERDKARETAKRRLDLGYRIKDDLLDERNRVAALTEALERIVRTHGVVNEPLYDHARCIAREALAAAGEQ